MFHIGQQHAFFTADESVWFDFHGPVPRKGETVHLSSRSFRVVSVEWIMGKWLKTPEDYGGEEVGLSAARVLVEPHPEPTLARK
jgi:hypothetical protein